MKISELKTKLRYNPETGHLVRIKTGKPAYCEPHRGYLRVAVGRKRWRAHRVCWALHYGYWPRQIDHINGVRTDNRLENLRDVEASGNAKNKRRDCRNKSGVTGVSWDKRTKRWYAKICSGGVQQSLGKHKDKADAIAARKVAEKALGFHSNHGSIVGTIGDS